MGQVVTKIRLRYVNRYRDRTGKLRHYLRQPGKKAVPLPGIPGSREFMDAYHLALDSVEAPPNSSRHVASGSLAAIVAGYYRTADFVNLSANSQKLYRLVLKPILARYGDAPVKELNPARAHKIISEIGAERPGMANVARAVMSNLMAHAIATEVRADNPFRGIKSYRMGSYHTWTDAELAAFEKRWPLGTRERLAFALLLYTGQRGGDVVRMERTDIVNGRIRVVQQKTGAELSIPVHPALARALKAMPAVGMRFLLTDAQGRQYRAVTELVARAAAAAGLPKECVAHGLRKAALRRLAEHGSTSKQIAAVSGHRTLREIERYTERADQGGLADAAIAKLGDEGERDEL